MKRTKTHTIKDALQQYIKTMRMQNKLNEAGVVSSWENTVGTVINNMTKEIFINNKKLFVRLNSSIAKQELMAIKNQLINELNRKAGDKVINELVFL